MELTHLKYFLEVARTEHVTQSAKTLCIVQPALTHALHKLEDELGVKLFKTQGRNIKLTEVGEYFYKKVKPLYEDIEALPAQLRAMADEQSATVNLNVLAASSFVTNAVILYKRNDPDLRFNLVQNEETTLYDICVRTYAKAPALKYGENSEEENFVCTENIYLAVPNTAQYRKRDSIKYKLIEYMVDKVGQEYDGAISGLTEWGMYVEIKPEMIEGMVALRDIHSDFFDFDEDNYQIVGKHTKKVFRLGDPVRIRVKSANLEQRLLDYELIETSNTNQ